MLLRVDRLGRLTCECSDRLNWSRIGFYRCSCGTSCCGELSVFIGDEALLCVRVDISSFMVPGGTILLVGECVGGGFLNPLLCFLLDFDK